MNTVLYFEIRKTVCVSIDRELTQDEKSNLSLNNCSPSDFGEVKDCNNEEVYFSEALVKTGDIIEYILHPDTISDEEE